MSVIPLWFWAIAAAVFGMAMGSFFSVLTYRWPREESLVAPRSHCTRCDHQLHWYENIPVVVIDLEHKLIPNIVVLPAAAIALVFAVLHDPQRWWVPVAGAAGAAAFLGVLWLVYPRGMGFGDVKLALLLGAVLGASVIPALAIAFFAGSIIGVTLIARSGGSARKTAVPFGPFLAAGALIALWAGPTLITWYTDRLG